LILLLLFQSHTKGQHLFESGYIITEEKDTIHGSVENAIDRDLAKEILFIQESATTPTIYKPEDIRGFGFHNGRTFDRKKAVLEDDSVFIFAKKVVHGKVDMWLWTHKGNPSYFISNNANGKTSQLLKEEKKKITKNGKAYYLETQKLPGILQYVLDQNPEQFSKKNTLKYSEKHLSNLVYNYNLQYQAAFPVSRYKEKVDYQYDVYFGLPWTGSNDNTLRFFALTAGINRRKVNVEKSTKVSFMQSLIYSGYFTKDFEYDGSERFGSTFSQIQIIRILPLGIHYILIDKRISPYIYAGLGTSIFILKEHEIVEYEDTGSRTVIGYPPYILSIVPGVGVKARIGSNYIFGEVRASSLDPSFNFGFTF